MGLKKTKNADLRRKYRRYFEISLIITLALVIAAFKFFPTLQSGDVQLEVPQELFTVEDIQQTKHLDRPPPPPKPPIPILSQIEEDLVDIEFVGIDNIPVDNLVPPPPHKGNTRIVEEELPYFKAVEEMPEPLSGIQAIQRKIVYPEIAKRAGVEGKVIILAFVDENGIVNDVEIQKRIGGGCDEAALEAVKKTKFKPGKQRGKAVRVQISIPVVFKLQ